MSHDSHPLHFLHAHFVAQSCLLLAHQFLHLLWLGEFLHSPQFLQRFHPHFLDQGWLLLAHHLLHLRVNVSTGVVVGVVEGAGVVVCTGVVVTALSVVTCVVGEVEEEGGMDVAVLPQRECPSWLLPENMTSSATVDVDGRPAELLKMTGNCEMFRKWKATALRCCSDVKLFGSVGRMP